MCVLRSVISYLVTRVDGTESESDSTRILDSLIAQIAGRRQISGEFLFFRKATNPLKFGLRNGANWQPEVGLCKGLRSRSAGSCSFDAINAIVLRPQSLLLRWSVVRLARSAASDGNERSSAGTPLDNLVETHPPMVRPQPSRARRQNSARSDLDHWRTRRSRHRGVHLRN